MKAITVTDQAAGAAGMALVAQPELQAKRDDAVMRFVRGINPDFE